MASHEAQSSHPDKEQRLAIAYSLWRKRNKKYRKAKGLSPYCQKRAGGMMTLDGPEFSKVEVNKSLMSATGILVTETRDRQGDILRVSGIDTNQHRNNPVILLDHAVSYPAPIGVARTPQGEYTVVCDADLGEVTQTTYFAQSGVVPEQIYHLICEDILRANSIGFRPLAWTRLPIDPANGMTSSNKHLTGVELVEGSWCAVPANAECLAPYMTGKPIGGKKLDYCIKSMFAPYMPEPVAWSNGVDLSTKAEAQSASDETLGGALREDAGGEEEKSISGTIVGLLRNNRNPSTQQQEINYHRDMANKFRQATQTMRQVGQEQREGKLPHRVLEEPRSYEGGTKGVGGAVAGGTLGLIGGLPGALVGGGLGSAAENIMKPPERQKRANVKKKGAIGSIIGGKLGEAGGGAAIGALFGPEGVPVGAAVGEAIGGAAGDKIGDKIAQSGQKNKGAAGHALGSVLGAAAGAALGHHVGGKHGHSKLGLLAGGAAGYVAGGAAGSMLENAAYARGHMIGPHNPPGSQPHAPAHRPASAPGPIHQAVSGAVHGAVRSYLRGRRKPPGGSAGPSATAPGPKTPKGPAPKAPASAGLGPKIHEGMNRLRVNRGGKPINRRRPPGSKHIDQVRPAMLTEIKRFGLLT